MFKVLGFRSLLLFFSLLILHSFARAQKVPDCQLDKIQKDQDAYVFEIIADEPFYVGGNTYVLNIGHKSFDLYRQADDAGKGLLAFIVPIDQYHLLKTNDLIYLTYGHVFIDESGEEEKEQMRHDMPDLIHFLGRFTVEKLKK